MLSDNQVNLVIMDINLPGKNGLLLARELREQANVALMFFVELWQLIDFDCQVFILEFDLSFSVLNFRQNRVRLLVEICFRL